MSWQGASPIAWWSSKERSTKPVAWIGFSLQDLSSGCMCWLLLRCKDPNSSPSKTNKIHSLYPPPFSSTLTSMSTCPNSHSRGKWTAVQGWALKPTSNNCIPACVCCQANLRTPSPDLPNQITSTVSFHTLGGELLDGSWKHWDASPGTAYQHVFALRQDWEPHIPTVWIWKLPASSPQGI
jgi:hypothetical protein